MVVAGNSDSREPRPESSARPNNPAPQSIRQTSEWPRPSAWVV